MFNVPILMYHRIADIAGDRNSLPPAMFARQLQYLRDHGYQTISLAFLNEHRLTGRALPAKPVILTFDDGYEDNFLTALPLLKTFGMTASLFFLSGWAGRSNDWEDYPGKPHCRMMSWEQLAYWHESGMEIGSHTVNHPFLSTLSLPEMTYELTESKALIEGRLGCPIEFLCYPYGDFDERVKGAAVAAGYQGALAIFAGTSLWRDDMFALKRIVISSRQPLWEFSFKISPCHGVFTAMRIGEKAVKTWLRK